MASKKSQVYELHNKYYANGILNCFGMLKELRRKDFHNPPQWAGKNSNELQYISNMGMMYRKEGQNAFYSGEHTNAGLCDLNKESNIEVSFDAFRKIKELAVKFGGIKKLKLMVDEMNELV